VVVVAGQVVVVQHHLVAEVPKVTSQLLRIRENLVLRTRVVVVVAETMVALEYLFLDTY
jgi:hypothetical protein